MPELVESLPWEQSGPGTGSRRPPTDIVATGVSPRSSYPAWRERWQQMSLRMSVEVWKLDLPQPLKLLALALADWADDWGNDVRPSTAYTAWKVGASVRTVQRQMRILEGLGIIEVISERGYRLPTGQWTRMLAIHPEKGPQLPEWVSKRGDNMTPPTQGRGDSGLGQGVTDPQERGDITLSPNTPEDTLEILADDFSNEPQIPRLPGESHKDYMLRVAGLIKSL